MYIFNPASFIHLVCLLWVTAALVLVARTVPLRSARGLFLLFWLAACLGWDLSGLAESMAAATETKYLWAQFGVLAYCFAVPASFMYLRRFSHKVMVIREGWAQRPVRAWLIILVLVPYLAFIPLVFSNNLHQLVWIGVPPELGALFSQAYWIGPVHRIMLCLTALYLGAAAWFMYRARRRLPGGPGLQYGLVMAGLAVTGLALVIRIGGFDQDPWLGGLDPLPVAYSLLAGLMGFGAGACGWRGLGARSGHWRAGILDAWEAAVLVLDQRQRLADWNRGAASQLGTHMHLEAGKPVPWPEAWQEALDSGGVALSELSLVGKHGERHWYELSLENPPIGFPLRWRLVVVRDKTERHLAEERMREQYRRILELEANQRDQVLRDSLTGLHNRRYFDEILYREVVLARREGLRLALLKIGLFGLELLGEGASHPHADRILIGVGSLLKSFFRDSDISSRTGFHEFSVILWGSSSADAVQKAHAFRSAFKSMDLGFAPEAPLDLCIGVGGIPEHGQRSEELVRSTHAALERARASGGGWVCLAPPLT